MEKYCLLKFDFLIPCLQPNGGDLRIVNGVRSNESLKYQRLKISGCKYIGIRKFEFLARTKILKKVKKKIGSDRIMGCLKLLLFHKTKLSLFA